MMIRKLLLLTLAASLLWVGGLFVMEQRFDSSINTLPVSHTKQIAAFKKHPTLLFLDGNGQELAELSNPIPEHIAFLGIDSEGTDTIVQVSQSFEEIANTEDGIRVRW